MDPAARQALDDAIGRVVSSRLDSIYLEVSALRDEVQTLKRAADPVLTRRVQVLELRRAGLSLHAIAEEVGSARSTVERDIRRLGVEAPAASLGVDGVARRPPSRPAASA